MQKIDLRAEISQIFSKTLKSFTSNALKRKNCLKLIHFHYYRNSGVWYNENAEIISLNTFQNVSISGILSTTDERIDTNAVLLYDEHAGWALTHSGSFYSLGEKNKETQVTQSGEAKYFLFQFFLQKLTQSNRIGICVEINFTAGSKKTKLRFFSVTATLSLSL